MKTVFNLNKYIKQAFYEDGRGSLVTQSRAWKNCYKKKVDEGMAPQEAWDSCLKEYQVSSDKSKWSLNYSAADDKGPKPYFSAKTPATEKLLKK